MTKRNISFRQLNNNGIYNEAMRRFLRSTVIDTQSFTFRQMTPSSVVVELQIVIDKNPNDPDPPLAFKVYFYQRQGDHHNILHFQGMVLSKSRHFITQVIPILDDVVTSHSSCYSVTIAPQSFQKVYR